MLLSHYASLKRHGLAGILVVACGHLGSLLFLVIPAARKRLVFLCGRPSNEVLLRGSTEGHLGSRYEHHPSGRLSGN